MPKHPLAANAQAMPETTTRRTALTAILGASAIAVGVGALSPADAGEADAALFDLLARWKAARARLEEAEERFSDAEDAADVEPPAALIRTEDDRHAFMFDKEPAGVPFRSKENIAQLKYVMSIFVSLGESGPRLERMAARAKEIIDAHREYMPAVEAARQAAGYYEAEAERTAAEEAEKELLRKIAWTRPQTVAGLLAKMSAIADAFGVNLEAVDEAEAPIPTFFQVSLAVLRDAALIVGKGTAI